MAEDNAIGRGGMRPWDMPADMKRFRELTIGKCVIMGRRTQETLLGPLDERINIVLTSDENYEVDGFIPAYSPRQAVSIAYMFTQQHTPWQIKHQTHWKPEIMVMGGEDVYNSFLPWASKMYLTKIYAHLDDADTFFPETNYLEWQLENMERYMNDQDNPYMYDFFTFVRRNK